MKNLQSMTIKEYLIEHLVSRGFFEKDAEEAFKAYCEDMKGLGFQKRWDDQIKDYPVQMQPILLIGFRHIVLKWIDRNVPDAWFRPLFMDDE
jgi:hypothetical protein